MTGATLINPSERAFYDDIEKARFQTGLDKRRWELARPRHEETWPIVHINIFVPTRPSGPSSFTFRFDLTGYPSQAPTARLWDLVTNTPLPFTKWPGGTGRVIVAFNPAWNNGSAIYLPCDRVALVGHDVWKQQHAHLLWSPTGDITQFLWTVYDILNSPEYTGLRTS